MPDERDEKPIRRYWTEIWNEGMLEVVAELYSPECIPNAGFSIERFQTNVSRTRASFHDFQISIDEIFSAAGRVVSRVTYRGTHMGTHARLPATGRQIAATGIDIFRLESGKIVEHWHEADHYGLFVRLGAVMTPGETAS